MLLQFNNINHTVFKKIEMTEDESNKAKELYDKLPYSQDATLEAQIYDVFEKHLQKEVEDKIFTNENTVTNLSSKIYLKFFDCLRAAKKGMLDFKSFIDELNLFSENDFESDKYKLQSTSALGKYQDLEVQHLNRYNAELLGLSKKEYLRLARDYQILLTISTESIEEHISGACELLNTDRDYYITLIKKNPQVLAIKPVVVNENVEGASKLINVSKEQYIANLTKNPKLMTLKTALLEENMEACSNFLGISKDVYIIPISYI